MRDSQNATSELGKLIWKIAPTSFTLASCLFLVSCGTFDKATTLAKNSIQSVKSVTKLVPKLIPRRIPIAEVRAEDLKKMPTGAEKSLAYERKKNRRRFAFIPGFYKPPTLPVSRSLPSDGGILPPLNRSNRSTN